MIRANRAAIKEESVARLRVFIGHADRPSTVLAKAWQTRQCGCRKSLGTGAIFAANRTRMASGLIVARLTTGDDSILVR